MEYQDFRNYFKLDLSNDDLINQNFMPGDIKNRANTLSELKKWTFQEICYTSNVTEEEVQQYDKLLQQRIEDIHKVINSHFELIKHVIQERKKEKKDREIDKIYVREKQLAILIRKTINEAYKADPDLKFEDYTYEKKFQMLEQYQNDLIVQDKRRIENRKSVQTVIRMKGGMTQTYFIFDSQSFKVSSGIFYKDIEEENENRHLSELEEFIESEDNYNENSGTQSDRKSDHSDR